MQLLMARERAGLTQEELAERAGLHAISISRYETGSRRPNSKAMDKLAKALGVTVEQLTTGQTNPSSELRTRVSGALGHKRGDALMPGGTGRAGVADLASQIEQRAMRWPRGTAYVGIEGDSADPVLWSGQLAILAPETVRPQSEDIVAVLFRSGPMEGQALVKWLVGRTPEKRWLLRSINPVYPQIEVDAEDWEQAEVRVVMGACYRPGLLTPVDPDMETIREWGDEQREEALREAREAAWAFRADVDRRVRQVEALAALVPPDADEAALEQVVDALRLGPDERGQLRQHLARRR